MPKNNNLLYKYTTSENINISIDKTGLEELTAQKNINNNTDPRSVGAFKLFEKYPMGNILLHKVPRAGATISLVLEAADSRHETVCIIVPTNMIASKTIINDIQKYSSHKLEIAQILANHNCLINQRTISQCHDVGKLKILPIGDCEECKKKNCPIKEVLIKDYFDVLVLTMDKLVALLKTDKVHPGSVASKFVSKIKNCKNIIVDEAHILEFEKVDGLIISDQEEVNRLDLYKYSRAMKDFNNIRHAIEDFSQVLNSVKIGKYKDKFDKVMNNAKAPNYYEKFLNEPIVNKLIPAKIKHANNEKAANFKSPNCTTPATWLDNEDTARRFFGEIIKLTKEREKYNLDMDAIIDLYTVFTLITNHNISIHGFRKDRFAYVELCAIDHDYMKVVKSFLDYMENKSARIILTSGTICSFDYRDLFKSRKIEKEFFGDNGDPKDTNSMMLILADSRRYRRQDTEDDIDSTIKNIVAFLDAYGDENFLIITLNKTTYHKVESELQNLNRGVKVTYFNNTDLMGVSSDKRICLIVGDSCKPVHSFDNQAYGDKVYSREILQSKIHIDTFQAINRVKDPEGKEPSLVIALGCRLEDCIAFSTWGTDRNVKLIKPTDGNKQIASVKCNKYLPMPKVEKCNTIKGMLLKAKDHRTPEVPYEQFSKILDRVDEIREMKSIESGKQVKLYKEDKKERFAPELLKFSTIVYEGPKNFLMDLDNRQDIYKIQEKDGLCTKMPYPLSEDAVELHLTGKKSIEVYQYNKENLIKWISFIINLDKEQDCNRLCEYLEYYNYPYRLEKSNTFNIFIRLKPISNKIAYEFGMSILNKVGINCEFLPKKTTVRKDENGQSIKLPLSLNSKIKVNNEFVRDFKNMELGIIDLSGCKQITACY